MSDKTGMNHRIRIFDSHLHIVDERFPLVPNNGYLPDVFSTENYLDRMQSYHLCGGAVVSGSFQAFDQSYLKDALDRLGPTFVGVTQLPVDVSDDEIIKLNGAGIRGMRFNIKRNGHLSYQEMDRMARRVHEVAGWHVELYVDSKDLVEMYPFLVNLPAVSVDHLGLSKDGFATLLQLAEQGVYVKATGFGRVDFNIPTALRELTSANPKCLMFGTDLPSTRAARPFEDSDVMIIVDALGEEVSRRVLYENAMTFYRLEPMLEQ